MDPLEEIKNRIANDIKERQGKKEPIGEPSENVKKALDQQQVERERQNELKNQPAKKFYRGY